MNDWSYGCLAKLIAASIAEAATRGVASAIGIGADPARGAVIHQPFTCPGCIAAPSAQREVVQC